MAQPALVLTDLHGHHGLDWAQNWVLRFRDAYRIQMNEWVISVSKGRASGASAWDGFVATSIAEQVVVAMRTGVKTGLTLPERPNLYV
jgi:myo-inositol 2-dehydrogenase/D-chiro-inositol 1-dehydrogenase